MDSYVIGIIAFAVLFLFLALGIPVGFSFIILGFLGLGFLRGADTALQNLIVAAWRYTSSLDLATVPLFTLMGMFLFEAGITRDLFTAAQRWLAGIPGGLAIATIFACTIFAASSGSSVAAVTTIGVISYKEMTRLGYDRKLAMGAILSGGTLAIMIPPSNSLIIYGVLAEQSIGKMFMAGVIPGIMLSVALIAVVLFRAKVQPSLVPQPVGYSWIEKLSSLPPLLPTIILIAVILGGLFGGLLIPSEAGAIGAFVAFLMMAFRKKLTKKSFFSALDETLRVSIMIYIIIVGVNAFQTFLVVTGLTPIIVQTIANLSLPGLAIIAIMLAIYIPLGCVMDIVGMLAITVPIFQPIVVALDFDPIWFAIMVNVLCELSLVTPPVGFNCFVLKNVLGEEMPLSTIFNSALPFYVAMFAVLALIFFFPQIALFLPSHM